MRCGSINIFGTGTGNPRKRGEHMPITDAIKTKLDGCGSNDLFRSPNINIKRKDATKIRSSKYEDGSFRLKYSYVRGQRICIPKPPVT